MKPQFDVVIAGAGISGTAAALELSKRGYQVALLDPGPLPHPLAASTDISKAVRMEYGPDEDYMEMGERARDGWLRWNAMFGDELYHEVGMAFLTTRPMAPGGFEYESYRLLMTRGHKPERMTSDDIRRQLPAWNADRYVDGFLSRHSGYAESGRAVEALLREAERQGVALHAGEEVVGFVEEKGRVAGVRTRGGQVFTSPNVVSAVGSWTPVLLPDLAHLFQAVGHPVFHLVVDRPDLFTPPLFCVFAADISNTGWYGFPLHPRAGVVKIANHGVGVRLNARTDERVVTEKDTADLRAFLRDTFPIIADAPIVFTRRCLYCDTPDEHFWIARDVNREGLTIAAGDSGHGFKFGPLWGGWIADALEGKPNRDLVKFGPREMAPGVRGQEAARYHGHEPAA